MDKYIGFDIDSKKTVVCIVQKVSLCPERHRPLDFSIIPSKELYH